MKIKKEFKINLVDSNLNVYKMGSRNKVNVDIILHKKESNYIEVEFDIPKQNTSKIRNNTKKMTLYSHGVIPFTHYYFLGRNQGTNKQTAHKIHAVYKFNNKFPDNIENKPTLQFRKVENKEEVEHRKRNINYKIKLLENETAKQVGLKKLSSKECKKDSGKVSMNEQIIQCREGKEDVVDAHDSKVTQGNILMHNEVAQEHLSIQDSVNNVSIHNTNLNNTAVHNLVHNAVQLENQISSWKLKFQDSKSQNFEKQKIENCIKNRVVVNYGDLLSFFPNQEENIKISLQRFTNSFQGRFILKNKFYDKTLQTVRNEIINKFEKAEFLKFEKVTEDEKFILHELCIFKSNKYKLKGYKEEIRINFKNKEILEELGNKIVFSLQDIKDLTNLEIEDIESFILENEIIQITDKFYCNEITEEIEEVLKLVEIGKIKKTEVSERIRLKNLDISRFFKVLEKFFIMKRNTWHKI